MEDRTQQMGQAPVPANPLGGPDPNRTVLTPPGGPAGAYGDPMRTTMGAPMRALEAEALLGSRYAFAPSSSREHLLLLLKSSGQQMGRRLPLNLCLVIDRSGSMEGEPLEY